MTSDNPVPRRAIAFVDYNCTASFDNSTLAARLKSEGGKGTAAILSSLPLSFFQESGQTDAVPQSIYNTTSPNHTFCAG